MIQYNNLCNVEPIGKELNPLMLNWTEDQRLDKYFEFCHAWDKREDPLLQHYTQYSHRLHWDENPFGDLIRALDSVRDKIWLTIVYSFTNEHWQTTMAFFNHIKYGLDLRLPEKPARHDLFQIYFPKGTKVREWLMTVPRQVSQSLKLDLKRYRIMEFAYLLRDELIENYGFRNCLYPCKNMSRNLGMAEPSIINPDSFVVPGTGSYRGYYQLFPENGYLMNKAKFDRMGDPANEKGEILLEQFHTLINDSRNPVYKHQYINHEDKACFFYKHIAMTAGHMKMRKQTPIEYIVPDVSYLMENKTYLV